MYDFEELENEMKCLIDTINTMLVNNYLWVNFADTLEVRVTEKTDLMGIGQTLFHLENLSYKECRDYLVIIESTIEFIQADKIGI